MRIKCLYTDISVCMNEREGIIKCFLSKEKMHGMYVLCKPNASTHLIIYALTHTHSHTHTHIQIMLQSVCVSVCHIWHCSRTMLRCVRDFYTRWKHFAFKFLFIPFCNCSGIKV